MSAKKSDSNQPAAGESAPVRNEAPAKSENPKNPKNPAPDMIPLSEVEKLVKAQVAEALESSRTTERHTKANEESRRFSKAEVMRWLNNDLKKSEWFFSRPNYLLCAIPAKTRYDREHDVHTTEDGVYLQARKWRGIGSELKTEKGDKAFPWGYVDLELLDVVKQGKFTVDQINESLYASTWFEEGILMDGATAQLILRQYYERHWKTEDDLRELAAMRRKGNQAWKKGGVSKDKDAA